MAASPALFFATRIAAHLRFAGNLRITWCLQGHPDVVILPPGAPFLQQARCHEQSLSAQGDGSMLPLQDQRDQTLEQPASSARTSSLPPQGQREQPLGSRVRQPASSAWTGPLPPAQNQSEQTLRQPASSARRLPLPPAQGQRERSPTPPSPMLFRALPKSLPSSAWRRSDRQSETDTRSKRHRSS